MTAVMTLEKGQNQDRGQARILQAMLDGFLQNPLLVSLGLVLLSFLFTRVYTGQQSARQISQDAHKVKRVPYWIPYIGHGLSIGMKRESFLAQQRDAAGEGIFALYVAGKIHNMIVSPSLAKQIWMQRSSTISSQAFLEFVMDRFFGQTKQLRAALRDPAFFKDMHNGLNLLQKEPQLTDAIAVTVREIEQEVPNLSVFLPGTIDQPDWERSSRSELVAAGVVEVDLFPLLRNCVGHIATKVLMGESLLRNYPDLLNDIWTLDSRMNAFYVGVPFWAPSMTAAYAARARIHRALADFHANYRKVLKGEDADYMWGEMSDVSDLIKVRAGDFINRGLTPSQCAPADLSVLWVMNINANSIIYWLTVHILSHPGLLPRILAETSPYVKVIRSSPSDPSFIAPEPPKISINMDGLLNSCPLLKSAYWETLRLDSYAWGYNEILSDITITESPSDAIKMNNNSPRPPKTYTLRKGEYVAIPFGAHHTDPRYFTDATAFNPDRFVRKQKTDDGGAETLVTDDMGTVRPFGGGASMCKGRLFAEREVLAFTAATLTLYHFEPADGSSQFVCPPHLSETHSGTYTPKTNLRVRMRHRA